MRSFAYQRVATLGAVVEAFEGARAPTATASPIQYLAGGTTLLDLMKLDVMRPQLVVDINALEYTPLGRIDAENDGLRLGAMVRMADAAEHPVVRRDYPVIAESLKFAASQQLRNMATLGGNVLQRTRCTYFRDTSYANCNKRNPGSGCAAIVGFNRPHAVLGTSRNCIATYAGDFAQALIALDAQVTLDGPGGARAMPFSQLHRVPGETPEVETTLAPGDIITSFFVPAAPWVRRSRYLKVRDRQSYEFALASAAVALDLADNVVREARIALGGVATVPWRAKDAEVALKGKALDETTAGAAAEAAFADAKPQADNAFKIALGKRTLVRALKETAAMEL
jgi:xanthine dehydrogenase YagS FAD-binding subunit